MGIAKQVYLLTRGFPKEEMYGLSSRIRRATISVPRTLPRHTSAIRPGMLVVIFDRSGSLAELETFFMLGPRYWITAKRVRDGWSS